MNENKKELSLLDEILSQPITKKQEESLNIKSGELLERYKIIAAQLDSVDHAIQKVLEESPKTSK